ncbi:hypothetical protein [Agaribacter marinus]|uniref:hypothetical protein n=1 Tax=Agaribacter marinus TaxID=1431249 RepID=UPI0024E0B3AF|nr:hypothetical protein [Agaribacter marinus]
MFTRKTHTVVGNDDGILAFSTASLGVYMDKDELQRLIRLLSDVNHRTLDMDSAQLNIKKMKTDKLKDISNVFANLHHFWSDSDIRREDRTYESMQFSELEKLINHLTNRNWEKANGVTFLYVS